MHLWLVGVCAGLRYADGIGAENAVYICVPPFRGLAADCFTCPHDERGPCLRHAGGVYISRAGRNSWSRLKLEAKCCDAAAKSSSADGAGSSSGQLSTRSLNHWRQVGFVAFGLVAGGPAIASGTLSGSEGGLCTAAAGALGASSSRVHRGTRSAAKSSDKIPAFGGGQALSTSRAV